METTTIQVKKNLKKKLDMLKVYPNEPMDSVIERLANMAIDEEPLSKEEIRDIEKSLEDIKNGKFYSLDKVKKDLGIK
jgi:predicted transcriptional regulator